MISPFNWFIGTLSLMAIFSSIAPMLYLAIAMMLLLLDDESNLWGNPLIKGGFKQAIVLTGLLVFCAIVPQVSTDMAKFSNPVEQIIHS